VWWSAPFETLLRYKSATPALYWPDRGRERDRDRVLAPASPGDPNVGIHEQGLRSVVYSGLASLGVASPKQCIAPTLPAAELLESPSQDGCRPRLVPAARGADTQSWWLRPLLDNATARGGPFQQASAQDADARDSQREARAHRSVDARRGPPACQVAGRAGQQARISSRCLQCQPCAPL
jgi:hypothetical protein